MATNKRVSASMDDTSRAILYEGANLSELSILFRMDHRVLVEKLHNVKASGMRRGVAIYRIDEVAPYLVRPQYDIEEYIKKMNHTELPKMLTKEFWAGQRSRQEYMLKDGDLWPTAKVVENVGELMKLMKMSVRLFSDGVERQSELTEKQRAIIRGLSDGLLTELHRTVTQKFKSKPEQESAGDDDDQDL